MNIAKNEFRITEFIKNNYPIVVFFLLMLALHMIMGFLGDDVKYAKVLANHSLLDYMGIRYYNWSSRIIIESFLVILAKQNLLVWKILDTILYTLGAYLVIKFVNRDNNKNILFLGVALFLMYPFFDMAGAGWISTTLNYSWCFVFAMIGFIPLINTMNNRKTSKIVYVISILSLLYAVNQEQSCALIFGLNIVYLLYCIIKKQKIDKYNVLVIFISLASMIMILTCPGNAARVVTETSRYYVDFPKLGIIEKLYLGTVPTVGILLKDKILFTVFYIILSICAIFKTENKYRKYVFYFNILLIIMLVLLKALIDISSIQEYVKISNPLITGIISSLGSIPNNIPLLGDAINIICAKKIPSVLNAPAILAILLSIYLLLSSALMLFKTFGKEYLTPLILFIAGFMSRLVVGFSPTIFESGSRTAFFFYITIIAVTLMLIKKLYDDKRISKVNSRRIKIIFAALGFLTYMGVFAIVYVMF